jgi:hypothetical protein
MADYDLNHSEVVPHRKLGEWRPPLFLWEGCGLGFAKTRQGPGAGLPKIHESGTSGSIQAKIDPAAIQPGTSPSLIRSKWESPLLHISSLKSRKSEDPIMQGLRKAVRIK